MNKARLIFLTLVLGLFVFLQYDLTTRVNSKNALNGTQAPLANKAEIEQLKQVQLEQDSIQKTEQFIQKFTAEVAEVGRLQNNPEQTQERLKKMANLMRVQDVQAMADIIADENRNGDERALALEILSIKNDTTSLIAMQNFVATANKISDIKIPQKKEFETVLRAQAVESISSFPQTEIALSTLSYLQSKVDNRFINDRISRATAGLIYGKDNLKEQDDEALKKLVE